MPFVTTMDNLISEDTSFSEDRRLVNWKKWLVDRKKQSRHIASVGRSCINQLQSSSEKFRAFVEMRDLMEQAALPVNVDKYRGGPEFWRMPESLPDHCGAILPKVSLTLPRKELYPPPDLIHVELPDLTASERSLTSLKIKEELWQRSDYLRLRKLELAQEIALLLPKEPETATLVVRGRTIQKRKIKRRRKSQLPSPLITITEPDKEQLYEDIDRAAILRIQDREFVWSKSLSRLKTIDTSPIVWSLIFESKIDERVEREIVLENKGTRVIVYYWRDSSFRPINMPFGIHGSPFFFNKTKKLIPPGQNVKIKVWFQSRTSGIFKESWRLVTEPRLNTSAFVVRFWGCTIHDRSAELDNRRSIDKYLDRCVRDSAVRLIIEEIIAGVEYSKPPVPVYKMLFLQNGLFVSRNPRFFYHLSYVSEIREMYCDVTDESMPLWDFSLKILQDILLQIKKPDYRRNMLTRFNELCKWFLRPNLYDFLRDSKRDAVYDILCAFANLFEEESKIVKDNSLIREELLLTSVMYPQNLKALLHKSNNNSQETDRTQSTTLSQNIQAQIEKRSSDLNSQLYSEIFFICIYGALEETIDRACAIIDSFNRLDTPDK